MRLHTSQAVRYYRVHTVNQSSTVPAVAARWECVLVANHEENNQGACASQQVHAAAVAAAAAIARAVGAD